MSALQRVAGGAVLGVVALAGCADDPSTETADNPIPTVTVTETQQPAPDSTSETPAESDEPRSDDEDGYTVGDTVLVETVYEGDAIDYKVSVLDYEATLKPNPSVAEWTTPDVKGNRFSGVQLQWCLDRNESPEQVEVSTFPWSLRYASGTVVDTTSFAQPSDFGLAQSYPDGAVVPEGTCVKGWAIYETPPDEDPTLVVYAPAEGETVTWRMNRND
jgi:hypothetical protein